MNENGLSLVIFLKVKQFYVVRFFFVWYIFVANLLPKQLILAFHAVNLDVLNHNT